MPSNWLTLSADPRGHIGTRRKAVLPEPPLNDVWLTVNKRSETRPFDCLHDRFVLTRPRASPRNGGDAF